MTADGSGVLGCEEAVLKWAEYPGSSAWCSVKLLKSQCSGQQEVGVPDAGGPRACVLAGGARVSLRMPGW